MLIRFTTHRAADVHTRRPKQWIINIHNAQWQDNYLMECDAFVWQVGYRRISIKGVEGAPGDGIWIGKLRWLTDIDHDNVPGFPVAEIDGLRHIMAADELVRALHIKKNLMSDRVFRDQLEMAEYVFDADVPENNDSDDANDADSHADGDAPVAADDAVDNGPIHVAGDD